MGSGVPVVTEAVEDGVRGRSDRRLFAVVVLSGLATLVVVYVVFVGRQLRPLADDYCLARWAGHGLLGGVEMVHQTWSGDVVIAFSNLLFVGLPLTALPWSLASVLPFFLGALSVAAGATVLLLSLSAFRVRTLTAFLFIPICMVMWWSYWWIPVRHPDPVEAVAGNWELELAGSLTIWQNINSAYIIPTSVWLIVWALLWRGLDRPLGWGLVLWALLALAMGLSGPVLALSFVVALVLLIAFRLIRGSLSRPAAVRLGVLMFGTLAGVGVALVSPGNHERTTHITETPYSSMNGPLDLLVWTLEGAARAWWGMLAGWSTLFVVLVAGLISLLIGTPDREAARRAWLTGGCLLLLSFCLHGASVGVEALSYVGFWHVVVPSLVMFWALVCLGWGCGAALAGRTKLSWMWAAAGGLALAVGAPVAVADMTGAISERYDRWVQGSAPFGRISDIEAGYVRYCLLVLDVVRDLPDRGPGST